MKLGKAVTWTQRWGPLRLDLHIFCAFLCLLLVTPTLASCRRQRSYIQSVDAAEEAAGPASTSPVILNAEWIGNEEPEHAFSNQLLLDVSTERDPETWRYHAKLRIVFPSSEEVEWTGLEVGTRKILEFDGAEYMVDLTEVGESGARISITRKL